jgi:hypothetical protein
LVGQLLSLWLLLLLLLCSNKYSRKYGHLSAPLTDTHARTRNSGRIYTHTRHRSAHSLLKGVHPTTTTAAAASCTLKTSCYDSLLFFFSPLPAPLW